MGDMPTLPLDAPPIWDTEWAGELMSSALRYLNERYVEGADLSGLGEWHDEIVAAGVAEDKERYRRAVRGFMYVRGFEHSTRRRRGQHEHAACSVV